MWIQKKPFLESAADSNYKRGKVKRLFKNMSGVSPQSDQTSEEVARDLIIRPAAPHPRSAA